MTYTRELKKKMKPANVKLPSTAVGNGKLPAIIGILFLLSVDMLKTISRNKDWQSDYNLYSSALTINHRNAKLHNNMGQVLENLNRQEEALQHYKTATEIEPDDVRGYLNVGRVLVKLNRFKEAEDIYIKAKKLFPRSVVATVTPNHLQLFLNLAFLISQNVSRLEEADA
ncbi:protein O-mannosyl-transferase TMTC3-like, partial [Stegodyphus dumicola]|uniref:protein O-mannosyl-transferase TMTC3-like n=1 Tax=Stegodyphus dumicola TaxID=202533 RepID=UPI0015A8AD6A